MYWQVKFAFGLIVVALLGGGVYLAWPYLPFPKAKTEVVVVKPGDPGDPGDPATPARPVRKVRRSKGKYGDKIVLIGKLLQKDPRKARALVENILKDPELEQYSQEWFEVTKALSEVNLRILFSDCPCDDKEDYVVKGGDSIGRIATQFGTTYALIRQGNNLTPEDQIYPNSTMRIYKGNWNIKISKSNYALMLFDAERLMLVCRIGIGKQDRTPVGSFRVTTKQKNPPWYYRGKKISPEDPKNPLGTRWMALSGTDENTVVLRGYGIHGTREPDSIGTESSNGCIRMLNGEVERLYDIVTGGTPVIIIE